MPARNSIDKTNLRPRLQQGATQLGLDLDKHTIELLLKYLGLLYQWNKTYNLTAVREPTQMLGLHLLDSLSIAPFIQGEQQLDVGTGAGLPGFVLALIDESTHWSLLDSNQKKTRFIQYAAAELGVNNISILPQRIQQLDPQTQQYDGICSRAYAELKDFVAQCLPLCQPQGRLLAMKGQYPEAEIQALSQNLEIESYLLKVPEVSAERHLIILKQPD